jgi:hypothetical protein
MTAEIVAKTLIRQIVYQYSTPQKILSDRGSQFLGAVTGCLFYFSYKKIIYHPMASTNKWSD